MPHVVVKLAPGSSEEQKNQLAEVIVKDVMRILDRKEEVISVALEEVDPKDWTDKVYIPDIQGKWNSSTRNLDITHSKTEELVMIISFENKVALVTGAASGLGLATAKA